MGYLSIKDIFGFNLNLLNSLIKDIDCSTDALEDVLVAAATISTASATCLANQQIAIIKTKS